MVSLNDVKPGYKTTEFWIATAVTLWGVLLASGVIPVDAPWVGVVGSVVASVGYSVSRGLTKRG
jgi:hypothetical protein